VLSASLLSFCLAKNESNKEKGDFFQTAPHEKRCSTQVMPFAYHRHALKLLPLLETIGLWGAWQLFTSIVDSSVVSPAKIKARSWAGLWHAYQFPFFFFVVYFITRSKVVMLVMDEDVFLC